MRQMKRVINGKKYNCETARCIGFFESRLSQSDFGYLEEELYLKKTGEYFLAGEGHGLTKYRSSCGNSSGYGYGIIPISRKEALEWASYHLDVEEIEDYFGEIEE